MSISNRVRNLSISFDLQKYRESEFFKVEISALTIKELAIKALTIKTLIGREVKMDRQVDLDALSTR
jgi:hypothetical protein